MLTGDGNAKDEHRQRFESRLAQIDQLDDPLAVYDAYISHLHSLDTSTLPDGDSNGSKRRASDIKNTLLKVLEQCTQAFAADARYRNDVRYCRHWLAYAACCTEPEDVFVFMKEAGIGEAVAAFYEEYARVLERKATASAVSADSLYTGPSLTLCRWASADAVLRDGLARGARPLERLRKAHADFLLRVPSTALSALNSGSARHASAAGKKAEVAAYNVKLVGPEQECSFEEARAKAYRQGGATKSTASRLAIKDAKIATAARQPLSIGESDDELDNLPVSQPVNPDDLTHISVYRDNTADIRELRDLAVRARSTASLNGASTAADDTQRDKRRVAGRDVFRAKGIKALAALHAVQRRLGRDGSGPNQTVSSFRLANGALFFLERQLEADDKSSIAEFVAVELQQGDEATAPRSNEMEKCLIRAEACTAPEKALLLREIEHVSALPPSIVLPHRSIVQ